jgi:hypothetical protein
MRELGGKKFGAKKGAEKSLGRRKGCVLGSCPKQLERPHPELVHFWLLVHFSPSLGLTYRFFSLLLPGHALQNVLKLISLVEKGVSLNFLVHYSKPKLLRYGLR